MEDETFTLLPLTLDPTSKAVSCASAATPALTAELAELNVLQRALLTLESPVPPPPVPVNPKRSAAITKLRESGNAAFRKAAFAEAIRMYTFGIEMALGRPMWEPSGLVRDEVAGLYANRAQAHMAMQNWVEGMIDAECSVEMKKVGNAKAWWRRGRCLVEMGRLHEAAEWLEKAKEFETSDADVVGLAKEVDGLLERREKGGK
jgi:translocation protein SEC72